MKISKACGRIALGASLCANHEPPGKQVIVMGVLQRREEHGHPIEEEPVQALDIGAQLILTAVTTPTPNQWIRRRIDQPIADENQEGFWSAALSEPRRRMGWLHAALRHPKQ